MILRHLDLQDFRGFHKARIKFDERLTVIIGANGAGKSSVLDALWILLDQYSARLLDLRASAKRLSDNDARLGSADTLIGLTIEDDDKEVGWALRKQGAQQRILSRKGSDLDGLKGLVRAIAGRASDEGDYLSMAVLPIYYDQRRALADVPQRKRAKAKHAARDAFAESRGDRGLDFRGFVYWFEERETEELRRQRGHPDYEDPQLASVRQAISDGTGLASMSYRPIPPRGLMVSKDGVELKVDQLSTGERVFLAMAGDLARRLAMLASDSHDDQPPRAVVLIDEIELHLHPRWQRKILPWMLEAFPHCQFIVTTHSPQVIGDVAARHLRILEFKPRGNKVQLATASKGRDSNYLLLSVFGTEERSQAVKKRLYAFEKALRHDDLPRATAELEKLTAQMEGSAPEVAIAQSRLARRKAAVA